ncbi:hypothetical protein C8R43DRAFT_1086077 [Mycena crocata]|nr:hypothetical protein C8R43DRAFT_1086077 [Mycena crocata]
MRLTATRLRKRLAKTTIRWTKAHAGNPGNEAADKLAAQGSAKPNDVDVIDITHDPALTLPGAKLQAMTQSIAYKIIRRIKMGTPKYETLLARRATTINMEYALGAATGNDDEPPSRSTIWKSIKNKDLTRSVRFFLWMLIHDGYKVGNHWKNIPGHEEKMMCSWCEEPETMEHILIQCEAPGQERIWELASELWKLKTGENLCKPVVGQIMACGAIAKGTPSTTQLFRILVSESAFLVWKLRNERVIQEKDPASLREIHNRWLKTINNRLQLDCVMTNVRKYGKKSLKKKVGEDTWKKTLKNEDRLPKNWTWETGVLVGVG